jgi:hypothetical protein
MGRSYDAREREQQADRHNLCTNELPMFLPREDRLISRHGWNLRLQHSAPRAPYGPASCRQGFVWRNAFDVDAACVTARQAQVQQESANAGATCAGSGRYGPNTCKSGFV